MSFFRKTASTPAGPGVEASPSPADSPAQAAKWAGGGVLSSKLTSVVVALALLSGPLALAGVGSLLSARRPAAVAPTAAGVSVLQQSAGAYAVGFVGSWLSATSTDDAGTSAYTQVSSQVSSQSPFQYRNIAAVSVAPVAGSTFVQVVVAADVAQPGVNGAVTWPRRYYAVSVDTSGGELAVAGFPAPVAGPGATTAAPSLGYGSQVPSTSAAGQTVTLFLSAYLAGQGDTTPYLSPGTVIAPVAPAPFTQVTAIAYQADEAPADHPADGSTVGISATARLDDAAGQQIAATYFLELKARAGRWEISRLQTTPITSDSPESANPTPSPSR